MSRLVPRVSCESHKLPLTFYCKHPNCYEQFIAFGCSKCVEESALHNHAIQAKYRQNIESFVDEITQYFEDDKAISQLINQILQSMQVYEKQNNFYLKNLQIIMQLFQRLTIYNMPQDLETQETLMRMKNRKYSKIKHKDINKLLALKTKLKSISVQHSQNKMKAIREISDRVIRKLRVNQQYENLTELLSVERQFECLLNIQHYIAEKSVKSKQKIRKIARQGTASYIVKWMEKIVNKEEVEEVELEICFDQGVEIKIESYRLLLAVFINDYENIKELKLVLTDAFIDKAKLQLLQDFLILMNSYCLRKVKILNKSIENRLKLKQTQNILQSKNWNAIQIDYYYD